MTGYMEILVWTMLFIVVVEMIFPNSHLQKYIKLILGFILIYTILAPILKGGLFEQGTYDEYVAYYQDQFNLETGKSVHIEDYEQEVLESYILQEEEKVKAYIEKNITDIQVEVLEIIAAMESYIPAVTDVLLTVSYKEEPGSPIVIPQIKIGEKSESIKLDTENLEKEIKNLLSDFYNWDKVNIHIIVQDI
ncbi:MAG: hypothetical protein ATN33_06630 [Epulopiscium sp. Nele67-Bin001]|nr:MAG: hypothetical protein BEN18_06070 [Epulopiscium sp. Nuni2H_MBin001]OON92790.1 MAG: hypothetical protein ATN33_06630 [Epulopiscium sp. Nele67-Bin001]